MVVVQLAKAAIAILLFIGLMAAGLALSPQVKPTPAETASTAPTTETTTETSATGSVPTHVSPPSELTVTLRGSAYENGTATVAAGGTVHWVHRDGTTAHSVTADDTLFDSSPRCLAGVPVSQLCMADGDRFDYTFSTAGTYRYHCRVHASMTGTITVV